MNNTDQAFIKAYSKLPGAQRQEKRDRHESQITGHYVDPAAGGFYRTETAHHANGPHWSGTAAEASPVEGSSPPRPTAPSTVGQRASGVQLPASESFASENRELPSCEQLLAYPPPSGNRPIVHHSAGAPNGARVSANGVNVAYPALDEDHRAGSAEGRPAGDADDAEDLMLRTREALESMRQGDPIVVSMRWESNGSDPDAVRSNIANGHRRWAASVAIDEPAIEPETIASQPEAIAAEESPLWREAAQASAAHTKTKRSSESPAEPPHREYERQDEPTAGELAQQAEQLDPANPAFRAVWEVDQFACSETIELVTSRLGQQLREVGQELARSSRQGLNCLAVTGLDRGVGTTTVAVQLARAAAGAGVRVALIDANYATPGLCDALGVEAEQGWDDALAGGLPVAEAAVQSIADDLTLVPLCPVASRGRTDAARRIAELLDQIADDFQLVILDVGAVSDAFAGTSQHFGGHLIDAAMIVGGSQDIADRTYGDAADRLRRSGIVRLGLVENFCTP